MAKIIAWAAAWLTGPIIWKILAALGIGITVFTGLDVFVADISANILSNLGALPTAVYEILAMSGVVQGMNVLLSAMAVRVGLISLKSFGLIS